MSWKIYLTSLSELFFPKQCGICSYILQVGEKLICTSCQADLPYTDYHTYKNNPLAKQLWGRVQVEAATALLFFRKGGKAQKLIHSIKYKGDRDLALLAGKMLGTRLLNSRYFKSPLCLFPVPLHTSRQRKRGYNQSTLICNGIAEILGVEVREFVLIRSESTKTQTKRNRVNRFENMVQVFSVKESLFGLHVLLVDDVITTGATIEACALKLLAAGAASVSIASLAYAE